MEQIQPYLDQALAFVRTGFDQINGPQGLLIALAATVFLQSWKQWLPVAIVAAAVHIAVDTLAPVLAGQSALRLPPLVSGEFWQGFAVLVAGYAVIIAVFFFIKRLLVRRSAPDGKPAKAR